ncbi:MAG: MetQ/NlpA family ABC transporter substrate-binding protein [Tetragenococcus koreensis]|nr:MetQ/NlpA family ABC transporter substrate-binding protein [Tetragenococcus koreensis]MDN6664889.1 MetQ/NlpA family ABC transporter substrate-binding protein [Tetragenococcus koreensis]
MKKMGTVLLGFAALIGLTACGSGDENSSDASAEDKVIKVAAQAPPMTDVVEVAAEEAEEDGWDIEMVQVNDNVAYNDMVSSEEADASFAQHKPFMEDYNEENDTNLVDIQPIYDAKVGFYSEDYDEIDEIPDGTTVAIPNDVSNEGRALAILEEQGLIKLKEGAGKNGTLKDVEENPKDFEWMSVDLLNLAEAYSEPDVSLVYDYPTYIEKIGLKPTDALFLEDDVDSRFSIQLVAREDNKDSEKIKALEKAMTSDRVRSFLEDEHSDTLIPSF